MDDLDSPVPSSFVDLPTEIIIGILSALDVVDLICCERVSKLLRDIVESSVVLQYKIKLYIAAYVDGPPDNTLPTSERMKKLEHHTAAWKNLTWQQMDTYTVEGQAPTYELYGGVFAQGLIAIGGDRGVTRGMKLIEFPSLLRDSPTDQTWTIPDFGFDVKDFGMDPSQDLLVLMEAALPAIPARPNPPLNVHLGTLRNKGYQSHRLADVPVLSWQPSEPHPSYSYWIQIIGDLLAVLFRGAGPAQVLEHPNNMFTCDELVVWNWKTGVMIMKHRFEQRVAQSFSFLSEDKFFVPITVRDVNTDRDTMCTLSIYQLPQNPSTLEPTLLAEYHLPPLRVHCVECSVVCRADPGPWAPPPRDSILHDRQFQSEPTSGSSSQQYRPRHPKPFGPAPDSRIIVLSIWMILSIPTDSLDGPLRIESRSYVAFVKAKTMLSEWRTNPRVELGSPQADLPPVSVLHWKDWGPSNTRWLRESSDHNWVCHTYGERYCRLLRDFTGKNRLRIMDFNDISFRKERRQAKDFIVSRTEDAATVENSPADKAEALAQPESDGEASQAAGGSRLTHPQGDLWETSQLEDSLDEHDDEWTDEEDVGSEEEDSSDEEDIGDDDDGEVEFDVVEPEADVFVEPLPNGNLSGRGDIIEGVSRILDPEVFEDDLQSRLPYRWSVNDSPEVNRLIRVMMDDERIVGLRRESDPSNEDIGMMVLDVFTM